MKFFFFSVLFLFSCNKSSVNWVDIAVEDISKLDIDKSMMIYFYADW